MRLCSMDGCRKRHEARGLCAMHYKRLRAHGDANEVKIKKSARGEPMRWLLANLSCDGKECLIWPFARDPGTGYGHMSINRSTVAAARVVCEHTNGPPPTDEHEAAHSCGNGHLGCVHPKHVRWATKLENEADKRKHGTLPFGESHGQHKLSEADILAIRASDESLSVAAEKYGVSPTQIANIRKRKQWRHVA